MLKKITNFTPEEFESAEHHFSIKRLSPLIGAELHDIDLSKDLSEEERDILNSCPTNDLRSMYLIGLILKEKTLLNIFKLVVLEFFSKF